MNSLGPGTEGAEAGTSRNPEANTSGAWDFANPNVRLGDQQLNQERIDTAAFLRLPVINETQPKASTVENSTPTNPYPFNGYLLTLCISLLRPPL